MSATARAIAAVLAPRGLLASGGAPAMLPDLAANWEAEGFTPEEVAEWADAGVWDATTAGELRDCGIAPADLAHVPTRIRHAACLGWLPIDELIAKITRRRRPAGEPNPPDPAGRGRTKQRNDITGR